MKNTFQFSKFKYTQAKSLSLSWEKFECDENEGTTSDFDNLSS
jgi:hypothetical protein